MRRHTFILGASGQIGSAVAAELSRASGTQGSVRAVRWSEINDPGLKGSTARIRSRLFGESAEEGSFDVIFANGLTDPRLPAGEIQYSNTEFPKILIESTIALPGVRYLTLGTVQERFENQCAGNPYLKSKLELGRWVANMRRFPELKERLMHVRIHTAYGNSFRPHLFLGQILKSLETNQPFLMSSGDQLREYHHVSDLAVSIRRILESGWDGEDLLEISSGNPIRLADLATRIFAAYGKEELLKVGAVSRPVHENTEFRFERSPEWLLPQSREPVAGIIACLRGQLQMSRHFRAPEESSPSHSLTLQ